MFFGAISVSLAAFDALSAGVSEGFVSKNVDNFACFFVFFFTGPLSDGAVVTAAAVSADSGGLSGLYRSRTNMT